MTGPEDPDRKSLLPLSVYCGSTVNPAPLLPSRRVVRLASAGSMRGCHTAGVAVTVFTQRRLRTRNARPRGEPESASCATRLARGAGLQRRHTPRNVPLAPVI